MLERHFARHAAAFTELPPQLLRRAPPRLTAEQLAAVAAAEVEHAQAEAKGVAARGATTLETLAALIRQSDLRLLAARKEAFEFKRDVVLGGAAANGSGKIAAEAVVRFYEEGLRSKATAIDKMRLKNVALRAQQQKLEASVTSKAAAGGCVLFFFASRGFVVPPRA